MFTKKALRNRNQNKSLGEIRLTSNFGLNFNKSALDHILLYLKLPHININYYYYYYYYYYCYYYYYYYDNVDDDDHDSESLRKDNASSFQATKLS